MRIFNEVLAIITKDWERLKAQQRWIDEIK